MDSLRYWVSEMHVDGFRFDLAPALARGFEANDGLGRFFALVQQDPTLAEAKLIAEPWDLGENGYRLGGFPDGWAEWNGKYPRFRAPLLARGRRPHRQAGVTALGQRGRLRPPQARTRA